MRNSIPHGGFLIAIITVAALVFGTAACSSSSKSSSSGATGTAAVQIKNFAFTTQSVPAGSTVTVKNNDTTTHTVTSDDGTSFNVQVPAGSTATFKAPAKAGTYKFHCNIHPYMHGTLTVT